MIPTGTTGSRCSGRASGTSANVRLRVSTDRNDHGGADRECRHQRPPLCDVRRTACENPTLAGTVAVIPGFQAFGRIMDSTSRGLGSNSNGSLKGNTGNSSCEKLSRLRSRSVPLGVTAKNQLPAC